MFFTEFLGPIVEGLGYLLFPIAFFLGVVQLEFVILYFIFAVIAGVFLSWYGVFSEVWSFRRYKNPKHILKIMFYGLIENFGYRQWKTYNKVIAFIEYLKGEEEWGKMERSNFGRQE